MKVLQLLPALSIGGAERVVATLCNGLAERGHRVRLVAIWTGGPLLGQLRSDLGVRCDVIGIRRSSILRPIPFLRDACRLMHRLELIVREFQPDIVQGHFPEDNLLLDRSVRRTRFGTLIPMVHSVRFDAWRPTFDLRRRLLRMEYAAVLRRASRVIAVSEAVKETLQRLTGVDAGRVKVLHNCIDLARFSDLPEPEVARQRLGLPLGVPLVVSVGRLHRAKNYPLLVRASAKVLARYPRVCFALVGEGQERVAIEDEIRRLAVGTSWRLLGQREDVPLCLAAADVFVQSSDWEGFPVAVVEAMAASLPVVATDVAGSCEVIRTGENGVLVPPGDAGALAHAIEKFLAERPLAQRMGDAARTLVRKRHSRERYVKQLEELFLEALEAT